MVDHSITNIRSIYVTNLAYQYPSPWLKQKTSSGSQHTDIPGSFPSAIFTGWHIIPNMLWGHVCTPRQWWEMVIKFESISVTGMRCDLFNPVPIQTAVSFQGTGTFPAFNNTVYAMGYTDDLYETPWFDWHGYPYTNGPQPLFYEYNPAYKEGLIPKGGAKYPDANDCADKRDDFQKTWIKQPVHYYTMITKNFPGCAQNNTYRRIFLPIYWYHYAFPQYKKTGVVTNSWRDSLSDWEVAWLDPSGTFWDPLNRPEHIMELRPGKNMISYSWNAHPSDTGIWFNTDRVALPTPYHRPMAPEPPHGWQNPLGRPRPVDPIEPGENIQRYNFLQHLDLVAESDPVTVAMDQMAPEAHTGLPSWREYPIVPTRWFLKEIAQQNPWTYENVKLRYYKDEVGNCPDFTTSNTGVKKGDVEITGPMQDIKFAGTEYEMYKYPPTQWFIKGIPLYDDHEKHIPVEMQMWMKITVHLKGKPRRSAIYAPTWGPVSGMDLYSVNMDTNFGENYIRGRSGGARRTWYNPDDVYPIQGIHDKEAILFRKDGGNGNEAIKVGRRAQWQCTTGVPAAATTSKPYSKNYATIDHNKGVQAYVDTRSGKRVVIEKDRDYVLDSSGSDWSDIDVKSCKSAKSV